MSTSNTPATVIMAAAPPLPVPTNPVSSFLKHHETLLIVVFGFILFWCVSGKVQDIIAAHDNANLTAVKATLAAQVDANKKTADLVAQQAADMKALNEKVLAQDAALAAANKALATALSQRQQTNNTLTIPQLLARWQQLVPNAGLSITNGQTTVSDSGAHATVNELEKVPVLEQQLDNEKKISDNTNSLLVASNKQVSTLNDLVAGKDAELKKADDTCKAEIKVVKDAATKSKRRWFLGGFVVGFVSRQAIRSYLGF